MLVNTLTIRDYLPHLQKLFDFIFVPVVVPRKENDLMRHLYATRKFSEIIGYSLADIPTNVDWFEKAYPDTTYRTSVQDTGIGISQQIIDKLNNRELLHTQPGTANEKGTGLGPAFCVDVIETSRGEFSICSTEGKGSTFTFTLPLAN